MKFVNQKTNNYHKPVGLLLTANKVWASLLTTTNQQNMSTLKLKNLAPVNKPVRLQILIDNSGSMATLSHAAVDSLNANISKFKEEATKTGIPTIGFVSTFNAQVGEPLSLGDLSQYNSEIDYDSYYALGGTALNDAVGKAILSCNSYYRNVILVITDGEENSSKMHTASSLRKMISTLEMTNTTLILCGPPSIQTYAQSIGFADGNIDIWDGTAKGLEKTTRSVVRSTESLYSSYEKGAARSTNFFQPDLNIPTAVVKSNLDEVTGMYNEFSVPAKEAIAPFVERTTGKPYKVGSAFYPLEKKVTLQSHKDIILKDSNGRLYTGDGVRNLLRIPEGGTIELAPATNTASGYTVFIKSTSHNRNLLPGSTLLVLK